MVEAPQSFIVREECEGRLAERLSSRSGRRGRLGSLWLNYRAEYNSSRRRRGARAMVFALDHTGVIAELDLPPADVPGPGRVRHVFDGLGALYSALRRVYELAISLPDAPLREFEARVAGLPADD